MAIFLHGVYGVLLLQDSAQRSHYLPQFIRSRCSEVMLLKRILGEVKKLIVRSAGGLRREIVVDDLPRTIAINNKVIAAMWRVWVVHEKGFFAVAIASAGEQ